MERWIRPGCHDPAARCWRWALPFPIACQISSPIHLNAATRRLACNHALLLFRLMSLQAEKAECSPSNIGMFQHQNTIN